MHEMAISNGNSVGVAISQPRVEGRSTSTLGKDIKRDGNSVGVAISRRRYPDTTPFHFTYYQTTPNADNHKKCLISVIHIQKYA